MEVKCLLIRNSFKRLWHIHSMEHYVIVQRITYTYYHGKMFDIYC